MSASRREYVTEPLGTHHNRADFSCGVEALDDYLHRHAGQDQRRNVARVFVTEGETPGAIEGYYTLNSLSIDLSQLPDVITRRLPRYPEVPAALIGRLAVARNVQGRGLGASLLMDALYRLVEQSNSIGIFTIVVDAIDDGAATFYQKYEFVRFPSRPDRLFLPVQTAKKAFDLT